MSYYRVCPNCGSNLDPGEICDCREDGDKNAGGYQAVREDRGQEIGDAYTTDRKRQEAIA